MIRGGCPSIIGERRRAFDDAATIETTVVVRNLPRSGGRGKESQMHTPGPFPASVLRPPSQSARCTCEHWVHCDCGCHGRYCDPSENTCDIAFLPDEGGLTVWGCPTCTPGEGALHYPRVRADRLERAARPRAGDLTVGGRGRMGALATRQRD